MPISIEMPRLSDTMEEGTLVKWRVNVGDTITTGDHLADVETDKATMELQAFDDGTVAKMNINEGQTVPVGQVILVLAEQGEDLAAAAETPAAAEPVAATAKAAPAANAAKLKVSPVARLIAEEHNIDLTTLTGTGPDGRIIKRDVPTPPAPGSSPGSPPGSHLPATSGASGGGGGKTIELSSMRKTIAKRLVESTTTIPHFSVAMEVDMDPLLELRQTLNAQLESQGIKLSVNDFITRAVAVATAQHPAVNSSWDDGQLLQHSTINVGIAVALPAERGGGLVVPVIRDALNKGLRQISHETKTLAKKARETGLTPEEMADGTITLSNLGMFGVTHFSAIINPPQAAILAVAAAIEKPVVRDGQLVVGHVMTTTLAVDHRVLDGAIASEFLNTLKHLLENPAALLV